jgi:prepilin-type N-terminal cleavage/methylation domain-containing protein
MKRNTQTINKTKFSALRGFTLLELIVVIAIIGILSVVVLPSFTGALAKARDSRKVAEIQGVATNLVFWAQENNGRYPLAANLATGLLATTGKPLPSGFTTNSTLGTLKVYNYVGLDCNATDCAAYQLWTELENKSSIALTNDSDVVSAADICTKLNLTSGTCTGVMPGDSAGGHEACTSVADDCVFDMVP